MLLALACPRLHTRQRLQNHISSSQNAPGEEKSTHFLAAISAALSTPSKKIRTTWKWNKVWQILDDSDNRWTCGPNIGSDFKKTH
jgi:hypothetical protein